MNGSEAIYAAIMESLEAQRTFVDEALTEARTGAAVRLEMRALQERGRTLPPITSSANAGDARGEAHPAGSKG